MRNLDLSSWQALLSTLLGLAMITLIGVGIRLLLMQTVQKRRERDNRQINERLRTLIAAYKTLGGSFTGELGVDPAHLGGARLEAEPAGLATGPAGLAVGPAALGADPTGLAADPSGLEIRRSGSDRSRRIRDAVEAALSDVILLGTEAQVRLAANAATELVAGRRVHTAELVVSLRAFIRQVLDLEPVPTQLSIPRQGPARPLAKRGGGASSEGGDPDGAKQGGGKGLGGDGSGGGSGAGVGEGMSVDDESGHHD